MCLASGGRLVCLLYVAEKEPQTGKKKKKKKKGGSVHGTGVHNETSRKTAAGRDRRKREWGENKTREAEAVGRLFSFSKEISWNGGRQYVKGRGWLPEDVGSSGGILKQLVRYSPIQ